MIEKYKKENANDVVYHLEYNSERKHLIIPEYGRHLQKLIEQATIIENDEERNKAARYIIQVMGSLNPHLRDVPDFQHKLWETIPSIVDNSWYFSIISCEFFIVTSTETLVNLPVFDFVVLITAPIQLNASSTFFTFPSTEGTINLNKYSAGQVLLLSNSTCNLS